MRFAYQVHTHRSPWQIRRLVGRILRDVPDAVVVVSHGSSGAPLDEGQLEALGDVYVLRHRDGYGDWTHIQRWLDCVAYLRDRDIQYDWLVTISGQDYPLRPLGEVQREILSSGHDGYLELFDAMGADSHWPLRTARTRYLFRHLRLTPLNERQQRRLRFLQALNRLQPLLRINVAFGLTVGYRIRSPFTDEWRCYGGSFWTTLSRACVEYVVRFVADNPTAVRYFHGALAPEEIFFQTVLGNSPGFDLQHDAKRYFDFSKTELNHPKVLDSGDIPVAIASGAFFGRKFDGERDPELLDALDQAVAA